MHFFVRFLCTFYLTNTVVLALILKAVYTMFMATKKHAVSYVIMAAALVLTAFWKIDAVLVIIGCAVFGLVWSLLFRKETEQ